MKSENNTENTAGSDCSGATCSPSSRALVCCFCGKAWSYDGESPKDPLLKEAYDHEAVCEKNPYLAQITELVTALRELSGLCERAWEGAIVGKPIRNHAKRVISKYPENVGVLAHADEKLTDQ